MTQPIKPRTCVGCEFEKRTTVTESEQKLFVCEDCLRNKAYWLYLESLKVNWKTMVVLIVLGVILYVAGFVTGRI